MFKIILFIISCWGILWVIYWFHVTEHLFYVFSSVPATYKNLTLCVFIESPRIKAYLLMLKKALLVIDIWNYWYRNTHTHTKRYFKKLQKFVRYLRLFDLWRKRKNFKVQLSFNLMVYIKNIRQKIIWFFSFETQLILLNNYFFLL